MRVEIAPIRACKWGEAVNRVSGRCKCIKGSVVSTGACAGVLLRVGECAHEQTLRGTSGAGAAGAGRAPAAPATHPPPPHTHTHPRTHAPTHPYTHLHLGVSACGFSLHHHPSPDTYTPPDIRIHPHTHPPNHTRTRAPLLTSGCNATRFVFVEFLPATTSTPTYKQRRNPHIHPPLLTSGWNTT